MSDCYRVSPFEWEILGVKIKIRPSEIAAASKDVEVEKVIHLLEQEFAVVRDANHCSTQLQVAVLALLRVSGDKLRLEMEYKESLEKMSGAARNVLNILESDSIGPSEESAPRSSQ